MRARLAGIVAVLCVVVVAWALLRETPMERLNDVVVELQARGEQVSSAAMDPPMPHEGQNGAPLLEEALRVRDELLADDEDWQDRVIGPWNNSDRTTLDQATKEQLAATGAFLEPLAPFFELVSRGVACDEIVWPLGRLDHFGYEVSSPRVVQPIQRFLAARAYSGATADERLLAIHDMQAMARGLRARTHIDLLIASTISSGACGLLLEALERGSVDAEDAQVALDPLLRGSFRGEMPDSLRRERAQLIEMLPFWFDGRAQAAIGPEAESFWKSLSALAKDLRRGRLWQADADPTDRLPDAILAMDALIELDPRSGQTYVDELERFSDAWARAFILLPRLAEKTVATDCHMALARVALAACVHRATTGVWPADARAVSAQFPDGLPLDPYSHAPFVFAIEGDELVISAQPWAGVLDPGETLDEYGLSVRLPPR
jgi:hypothetical protein